MTGMAGVVLDVYARVAQRDDEKALSQVAACEERIRAGGAQVGKVFIDQGTNGRPEWDRLMQRLESGDTGGICIADPSRFSRHVTDWERLMAATERGQIVLDGGGEYTAPDVMRRIRLAMDEYESDHNRS